MVNLIITNVTGGSLVTWCTLANIGSNTSSSILTFGTTNWCLLFNNSCTKTKRKYSLHSCHKSMIFLYQRLWSSLVKSWNCQWPFEFLLTSFAIFFAAAQNPCGDPLLVRTAVWLVSGFEHVYLPPGQARGLSVP